MLFRNDGKGESNTVQNRFTAYAVLAVQRKKSAVLRHRREIAEFELSVNFDSDLVWMQNQQNSGFSELMMQFEIAAFEQALDRLSERDRYILIARLLHKRAFSELAQELGLGYKGVTAVYYRAIQRIRKELRGDEE